MKKGLVQDWEPGSWSVRVWIETPMPSFASTIRKHSMHLQPEGEVSVQVTHSKTVIIGKF